MSSHFPSRQRSVRKYHQGWVYVKQNESYRQLFAELQAGKCLRFYANETRAFGAGNNCQLSIDLRNLKEIGTQSDRRPSNQHPEYLLILKFHQRSDVKLRITSPEDRETWVRFLRAAALKQLPQDTSNLLPGQIHEMQDIIQNEEREDVFNDGDGEDYIIPDYTPMSPLSQKNGDSSRPWFYPDVFSRDDAEKILLQCGPTNGNILLRCRQIQDDRDPFKWAISAVIADSAPKRFHHYKVQWSQGTSSYEIALSDGPHPRLNNLEDVISYFERKSSRKYRRLSTRIEPPDHTYEQRVFVGPVYQNVRS